MNFATPVRRGAPAPSPAGLARAVAQPSSLAREPCASGTMARPMSTYDVDALRREFPALGLTDDGLRVVYLDGPGGTQVPQRRDRRGRRLLPRMPTRTTAARSRRASGATRSSARRTRRWPTSSAPRSARRDQVRRQHDDAHVPRRPLDRGDRSSRATRSSSRPWTTRRTSRPWRAMAADRGVTVQTVDIHPRTTTLDLEDLESKLGPRTKLVAVGYAVERGRHDQPRPGDRRPGPRGRAP